MRLYAGGVIMSMLHDEVYDNGLNALGDANLLHVCSQEPATYTEAVSTYSLGSKAAPNVGSPADRDGGGREVIVAAISDGAVSADGSATHYSLADSVNSRLLAANSLSASQQVYNGNSFTLPAYTIGIPDPA